MSSSISDPSGEDLTVLPGNWLAELQCALAEARDYSAAADLFLRELARIAGVERGAILSLTESEQAFETVSVTGFGEDEELALRLSVEDIAHPVVVSALSLLPARSDSNPPRLRIPYRSWVAIPFPRPVGRTPAPLLDEARARDLLQNTGTTLFPTAGLYRREGHGACGILLLEGHLDDAVVERLSQAAMLAGPVLSRMASVERYRRSAERLDQQRDLLTAIVNSLPDPIVITDAANDIVVQNRRAEHLLSFGDADSEGRRRAVEINNLLFTSFLSKSVMAGGIVSGSRELNLVDPDEGADLLFEVIASPLAADVSRMGSVVSVLRDVTDLRRASNELERQVQRVRLAEIEARREGDRLNLILENVADPILVTDDRSNIILMNQQAEVLFQDTPGANRARAQAVSANDTKFTTFISDFTMSGVDSRREQMELLHPATGGVLPVEVVSGKILNERGEPLAIVSVLHDLTKQVENERLYDELKAFSSQLEERIRAATADLAEQNARLQWQSRELEKANRLKSEFLASMSHELRTPINALIGYTSLMLDRIYGDLTARQEEGLRRIQSSAQHLLALINDILDLAKIEAGKMPLHLEETSLQRLLAEIGQQIEPMVRKRALEYKVEIPEGMPPVHTDRVKVKQILLNLLSNAVKFTHEGSVTVQVTSVDDSFRIDVIDTGIGILPRDLEPIWEDFRQLDQSRTREYGGTGLGLSITKKLVERLGGEVSVKSVHGEGSTFTVLLPKRSLPNAPGDDDPVPLFIR